MVKTGALGPTVRKMYAYAFGAYVPVTATEEKTFLQGAARRMIRHERFQHANSGRVSEWVVRDLICRREGLTYQDHVRLPCKDGSFIFTDGYIPELDLYVEVKSRSYHTRGTISEKLDGIPRKYARVHGPRRRCVVVLSAYQAVERTGTELLGAGSDYAKDFRRLALKYGIVDWVSCAQLGAFLAGLSRPVPLPTPAAAPRRKRKRRAVYMTRARTAALRRSSRLLQRANGAKQM